MLFFHAKDGTIQEDVLSTRELGVKPGSNLKKAANAPT
jgi:hypothetical protein